MATTNPYGYASGYTDAGTGYTKFGTRYYNQKIGRFVQPDPASTWGGYPYTSNDPLNHSDPTGNFSFSISGSVCAFGGCLSASVGVDDDGDVNLGGSVGVGGGGGIGWEADPDGDYTSGEGGVSVTAQCNVGPVSASHDFVSGENNATVGSSEGVGCSASAGGNYTF